MSASHARQSARARARGGDLAAILQAKLCAATLTLQRCEVNLRARCDPDSVHALRVAVRRLRALLWSIKPWVRRERYRRCSAHLKSVGRLLAPARDLDVIREVLLHEVAENAGIAAPGLRLLGADTSRLRVNARRKLRAAIRTALYAQCSRQVRELLVSRALLRTDLPAEVSRWRHRVLRGVARFDRRARRAGNGDLHQIRIRAKRCRYALEALAPDAPRKSLQRLKALQALLGRYCDARLVATWLQRPESLQDQALRRRLLRAARGLARRRARASLRALHRPDRLAQPVM